MAGTRCKRSVGAALVLAAMVAAACLPASCSSKERTDPGVGGTGGSTGGNTSGSGSGGSGGGGNAGGSGGGGGGSAGDGASGSGGNAGGSGGSGAIDGGPIITDPPDASNDGEPPDTVPDLPSDLGLPFTGQRSYTVTATLQRVGGIATIPASHAFTLVLDADQRTWIASVTAQARFGSLEPSGAGAVHITGPVSFRLDGCFGSVLTYNELTIAIDASGRLTGTGQGPATIASGDTSTSATVTMVLAGAPDTQSPALALPSNAGDPFASFAVTASEALLPTASASLLAPDGETIALSAAGTAGSFVTGFQKPPQVLRFATRYQIVTNDITDFAGNSATASALTFTTAPLPPLSPEDGFESVTATTYGGVQVLSGAGAPTITGAKSIYILPTNTPTATQPMLAVRLALAAGDTVVRFAYRTVGTSSSYPSGANWSVASVGGAVIMSGLSGDGAGGGTTSATIGGAAVTLGPLTTASFPLPVDATNEVVLQRTPPAVMSAGCGIPFIGADGILIDDLRVE